MNGGLLSIGEQWGGFRELLSHRHISLFLYIYLFFYGQKARKGTSSILLYRWNIFSFWRFLYWQKKKKKGLALQVFLSSVTEEMSTSPPLALSPLLLLLLPPLFPPPARRSSEGHELKLPLGLPLRHPHWVGGVLRYLHDADGERVISLVDMVSHYLAGGKGDNKGS